MGKQQRLNALSLMTYELKFVCRPSLFEQQFTGRW